MLISLQAMIAPFLFCPERLRAVACATVLSVLASAAIAQEPETADPSDPVETAEPVETPDPVAPAETAAPALVLPEFCEASGVSAQQCLNLLGQLQVERYCRIKGVDLADCAGFIAAYALPNDCRNADLSAPGCIDFLESRTRLYREQVKGLIAQCNGEDLSVCQAFQDENTDLSAQLAGLEAEIADLQGENASLKDENASLTAKTETLGKDLALAEAAVEAQQVDVVDVCRAAALRLNARAEAAFGEGAPVLDEEACARNPLAEITRFLGAQDLPRGAAKTGTVFDDPAPGPDPQPAPEPAEQACTALPTEDDLVVFLVTDPGVFGSLEPARFNRLVRELTQGNTARAAVDVVWPTSSGPDERDLAVEQLCTSFPVTCPDQSGVEVCP
ncbi:hypothetical protein [Antarctobacter jejuensis]|uniref:hypothetical protein n=1 Tax=Antarctobacter jejuensis TaxID=1439938 RepID=UPI003FD488A5